MTLVLFLGAGNVVFAPMLGAHSGEHFLPALSGFLNRVGLPALALVIAMVGGSDQLTQRLPKNVPLFWVSF